MKQLRNICLLLLMTSVLSVVAQPSIFTPGDYRDGIYDKENAVNRRYIPYTHLREADVAWEKRVWRQIDMREKINQTLYFPVLPTEGRMSLIQVVLKYVLSGQILAFRTEDFQIPFERDEIKKVLIKQKKDSVDVEQFDEKGEMYTIKVLPPADSLWTSENLCSVDLKEDWFFDKQKSTLEVRIIGISFSVRNPDRPDLGCNSLFSVYYPSCRPFFAKHEVFNTKNDSERRTFEDVFWKRMFSSKITKESNVYDRDIEAYSKGIDALLESDRIKGDIFRWEHDLWHF
jgi:gliding motility associated protien GldN